MCLLFCTSLPYQAVLPLVGVPALLGLGGFGAVLSWGCGLCVRVCVCVCGGVFVGALLSQSCCCSFSLCCSRLCCCYFCCCCRWCWMRGVVWMGG